MLTIGTAASMSPAKPLGTRVSAWPRSTHGSAISISPNATTNGHARSAARSAPWRAASGRRIAAPSSVRQPAMDTGDISTTAILMKR